MPIQYRDLLLFTSRFSLTTFHICFSRFRVSFKSAFIFIRSSYESLMDFGREMAENLKQWWRKKEFSIECTYRPLFIFQVRPPLGLPLGTAFSRSFS